MATFDSGRRRYSMNFYASHQRPLQRRSYTGRPSRPAEGQLRVKNGSVRARAARPFYPQEQTSSACLQHVRLVPIGDIPMLFNRLSSLRDDQDQ
jgi:hypothetical protein